MAASTEHLTTQLQNKLKDGNILLEERLDVAQKSFCSSTLPILQKEEQVLSWIFEILQDETTGPNERKMSYDSLLYCFKSNRMKSFNGNIRSSAVTKILQMLKYVDDHPEDLKDTIRKCCVEVMNTPYFQRLFMCDVNSVCKLMSYYFSSVNSEESTEDFINAIDQYLYINKMCLIKGEFRNCFVKEVLRPLCVALVYSPKDKRPSFHHKAISVFREVLFYEPKFIENFIEMNTKKVVEPTKEMKTFNKKLKHMPTRHEPVVVELCYSIFLKAVISKYPEKFTQTFRVFTILTPSLGIIVNQLRSIEMNPVNNWQIDNSFVVVKTLVDVLDKSKVPLNCSLEEVTLQNWFTGLVIGLTNINNKMFSVNFLEMLISVLEFNPLVIETASKALTMIMLQIKSSEIKENYIKLIRTVISGSSKLQRLQKFISFFLQHMRECLMVSCEEDLVLEDVLPKEVSDEFSQAVVQLPNSHLLAVLKSFIFHLQRDCLPLVEGFETDTSVCINMEVITEMTYQLLQGTNIADHSVPDIVKQKFKHILEEMQVLLKQFGLVFQELHEDRLLRPYFLLCKGFGAMKLLFREYDNIQIVAPTDVDLEPTNLCYVHNYMFPDNWKKIALMVENHEDCEAKHEYFELMIQKIVAVAQVEEGDEGPGTQIARYLLNTADLPWLWEHLTVLAPLFQSAELAVLVKKIVDYIGDDQSRWLPLLKEEAFSENRRLVLATGFQLMSKASEGLCLGEVESVSYQMLSLVDNGLLLEYELSQMITDDVELKESIDESLEEMSNILNERLLEEPETVQNVPHLSVFEVPARLPLHHFSATSQSCALVSAVSLLYQLPFDSEADLFLFNLLLKIMDGPKRNDKTLLGKLNPGTLLRFIATRGRNYRGQRKLMKRICLNTFQTKSASKKLFKKVCSPDFEDLWVTALVVDSLLQFKSIDNRQLYLDDADLVHDHANYSNAKSVYYDLNNPKPMVANSLGIKNKFLGSAEDKKPMDKKNCLEHLISSIIPLLCSVDPSPDHLYSYSIAFKYSIKQSAVETDSLQQLMPTLKQYIEFAMTNYKTGSLLIETLIQHRADIDDEDFPNWLMSRTWQVMRSELMEPQESVSHLLLETATLEEFKEIIPALLVDTETEMQKEEWDFRMANLLSLWCHLASSLFSTDKSNSRDEAFISLVTKLPTLATRWQDGRDFNIIPIVVELISSVARNTSISMRPIVLDSYMTLLQAIPLPKDSCETVVSHLTLCMDALFALYLFRTSLLVDRLPAIMQLFRMFMVALASVAKPSQPEDLLKAAIPVADKMERAASKMVKRQKDFVRLAPYIIADVMNIFQKHNLNSDIKFSYTNIVNHFLSICDNHAIDYLKGALPLGQQEMFNTILDHYNRYNRFVGKI